MPKVIFVSGPSNTEKTTSIKNAMQHFGVDVLFRKPSEDISLCVNVYINGNNYKIGFATGGDTLNIVNNNINFFKIHKPDCMVFACRSRGAGLAALNTFVSGLNVNPIIIKTGRSSNPSQAIAGTVRNIITNIP